MIVSSSSTHFSFLNRKLLLIFFQMMEWCLFVDLVWIGLVRLMVCVFVTTNKRKKLFFFSPLNRLFFSLSKQTSTIQRNRKTQNFWSQLHAEDRELSRRRFLEILERYAKQTEAWIRFFFLFHYCKIFFFFFSSNILCTLP